MNGGTVEMKPRRRGGPHPWANLCVAASRSCVIRFQGSARNLLLLLALLFVAPAAWAHVGSPDVFFEGKIGPYPAQITVRVPPVVPGLAQIEVRPETWEPLHVSFLPLYARTAVKNAPPADLAHLAPDEPGVYTGELWLMRMGGYSIEVRASGASGSGAVQVPVNSVATHQLPMPPFLGNLLLGLGGVLVFGLRAIVQAAASESVLAPGAPTQQQDRRRGRIAAWVARLVIAAALAGGWYWWKADEQEFRRKLREGAWPDLVATVDPTPEDGRDSSGDRVSHAAEPRILHLTIGEKTFQPDAAVPLLRDHDKLLHAFLIREPQRDVFAHVHPVRRGGKNFDLVLPPLPEGDYRVLCDMTFSDSGVSSTATTTVHLPAPAKGGSLTAADLANETAGTSPNEPAAVGGPKPLRADADDSWAEVAPVRDVGGDAGTVCPLPGGRELRWAAHPALRARHNAHLKFTVRDTAGKPLALEPYMGMMSHAAVMRADGRVFAHLHPTGNYSMAAQTFFTTKIEREATAPAEAGRTGTASDPMAGMDHAHMHHGAAAGETVSSITLPYEFPTPGDYQIWVQIKTGGEVLTGAFLTHVAE